MVFYLVGGRIRVREVKKTCYRSESLLLV
jgi:hypothetical protein